MRFESTQNVPYMVLNNFIELMRNDEFFTFFRAKTDVELLDNDNLKAYVLIDGDTIIGWGHIELFDPYDIPTKQHVCRLGFCIHPDYRENGYGKMIVDEIILRATYMPKIEKLVGTTRYDNYKMANMFLKRGFKVEGFFVDEERINGQPVHYMSFAKDVKQEKKGYARFASKGFIPT